MLRLMAPKKKPHGKDIASPSSTPPHFDRRRFWNAEAEDIYTSLLGKSMHRERGVDISLPNFSFLRRAREMNWEKFVEHPGPAVASVVREFYANLKVRHENYRVRVRGKMVAFDSATINAIYEMPSFEEDDYRTLMNGTVNYMEIMQETCTPGATWKLNLNGEVVNFESKYLKTSLYHWFVFVTSRIMPSNHTSQVTKERAALIYCIAKGMNIDAGRMVQTSILHSVRGTTTLSMPHTSLITELCRHAGVTWNDNEELIQPRTMIDIKGVVHNRRGVVRNNVDEEIPAPLQVQEASPPRAERTMEDRMTAIEHGLEQHRQEFGAHRRLVEDHMRYMHDFNFALSQRFQSTSADYIPFPQPPTWPPRSRDPADDDTDMGPGGGNEY